MHAAAGTKRLPPGTASERLLLQSRPADSAGPLLGLRVRRPLARKARRGRPGLRAAQLPPTAGRRQRASLFRQWAPPGSFSVTAEARWQGDSRGSRARARKAARFGAPSCPTVRPRRRRRRASRAPETTKAAAGGGAETQSGGGGGGSAPRSGAEPRPVSQQPARRRDPPRGACKASPGAEQRGARDGRASERAREGAGARSQSRLGAATGLRPEESAPRVLELVNMGSS
uniref:uncharacterized protein LOC114605495 n=1 Tax=Podarcis muralis TaxID=64176 RepID=UPI00109F5036|nr:uncharacterized protein LOC114605495 [Podarcis muralis]